MTKVALVRHGMTDWNLQGRIQGIKDIPLSEEGRSQARAVARRLGCEEWHRIYSSDLIRAAETARMVADALKLPVTLDSRLREKAFGNNVTGSCAGTGLLFMRHSAPEICFFSLSPPARALI